MGFCSHCGEVVRSANGVCSSCGGKAVDSATSGMVSKDNRGDIYSNAFLSSGFAGGVESGLKRMLGQEDTTNEVCIDCGKSLTKASDVFVAPTDAGGHAYCEVHYAAYFSKGNCAGCDKPVLGLGKEYVKQDGKIWHRDCFTDKVLCNFCREIIFGQAIQAINKFYHPKCLKCSICATLLHGTFIDLDGAPTCSSCAATAHKSQLSGNTNKNGISSLTNPASSSSFTSSSTSSSNEEDPHMKFYQRVHGVTDLEKRCDKCLEVVQTGGVILPGNSGLYHTECFRCKQCDKVINGKYSIAEGGGVICVNCIGSGNVVDANNGTMNCGKCHKPIVDKFVKHENISYHSKCFTCSQCNISLGHSPFGINEGNILCESCLKSIPRTKIAPGWIVNHKSGLKEIRDASGNLVNDNIELKAFSQGTHIGSMTKKNCPNCNKPTWPGDEVSGPLFTTWHKQCLRCKSCHKYLDSMANVKGLQPFCRNCYSKS